MGNLSKEFLHNQYRGTTSETGVLPREGAMGTGWTRSQRQALAQIIARQRNIITYQVELRGTTDDTEILARIDATIAEAEQTISHASSIILGMFTRG